MRIKNGFTTAYCHNELLILEEKKSVSVYLTLSLSTFCLRASRVSFEPKHKILKYDLFNQISGFSISIDALCTLILHLENIFLSFTLATLEVSSSYQLQHQSIFYFLRVDSVAHVMFSNASLLLEISDIIIIWSQ